MNRIAIIIARGGSKRIHRKNIKPFNGRPIIFYPIKVALDSGLFSDVMVSTDDDEIKQISLDLGAKVPFKRSDKNSNDFATSFDVVEEVLNKYREIGKSFDEACLIYPTAVFINVSLLLKAFKLLSEKKFDSVFPVLKYSHPIQRAILLDEAGAIKYIRQECKLSRTQDLKAHYHDSGQFYVFKTRQILIKRQLITNKSGAFQISEMQAHDIDNLVDWEIAEFKIKFR